MALSGSAQPLQKLRLFNEKAEGIMQGRFAKQVFHPQHGFTWITPGDGSMETEWRGADVDATKALALDLRYFIWTQTRDGINLKQVRELYGTLPICESDKQAVRDLVDSLDRTLDSTAVIITTDPITWRRLIEVFMYGGLAHANNDRLQHDNYRQWTGRESTAAFMRHNFEKIAKAMIYVICQIRHINKRAIMALETDQVKC